MLSQEHREELGKELHYNLVKQEGLFISQASNKAIEEYRVVEFCNEADQFLNLQK